MVTEIVQDRYLEQQTNFRGGKPRIVGTRITVSDIAVWHLRLGLSVEEIAVKYDLPLAAIHAALSYYYDHRHEVDRSIEEEHAFYENMRRNTPSLVAEKLRAASHA